MPTIQQTIVLAIAIGVGVLVAGILVPVGVDEVAGNTTTTLTHDNQTTKVVNAELTGRAEKLGTGTQADVELNDTRTSGTTKKTISVGDEADYSLTGGTVTVGVESVTTGSPDTATINYTYDKDYEFSSGARTVWGNLDLFVILGVVGLLVGYIRFRL